MRYITQGWTFFDCLFIFVPEEMSPNTLHFFILYRKHNLDIRCSVRYVSPCRIYFICQKSSHRFLLIFFSVIEDTVLRNKIWNKRYRLLCSFNRKQAFISLSSFAWGNLLCYVCARAHLRVLMTRKLCAEGMRNAILRNHLKQTIRAAALRMAPTNNVISR